MVCWRCGGGGGGMWCVESTIQSVRYVMPRSLNIYLRVCLHPQLVRSMRGLTVNFRLMTNEKHTQLIL